jgi:hypothetical protein
MNRTVSRVLAVCLSVVSLAPSARAQSINAQTVKAAFLYNFVKFSEWPSEALTPGQRLSLCVLGDAGVAEALERTINGQAVDGHQLTVEIVKAGGPIRPCHILYMSGLDSKQLGQLLTATKRTSTFTVSDSDRFAQMGGMAQLIEDDNRMRFAVNIGAATEAHIKVSSRLLGLAQIVKTDSP